MSSHHRLLRLGVVHDIFEILKMGPWCQKNIIHHRLLRLGVVDPGTAREVNLLMDHREEIEVDIIINNKSTIPIITIPIIRRTRTW